MIVLIDAQNQKSSVATSMVGSMTGDTGVAPVRRPAIDVLWGKSNAGGRVNLLIQHLLDTAAVGELLWDALLAPAARDAWDSATAGRGRDLLRVLCGLHDLGKASPAFQAKEPRLAKEVRTAGLSWDRLDATALAWHHTIAGARALRDDLTGRGWERDAVDWMWPFLAGHHGKVPSAAALRPPGRGAGHGQGRAWQTARAAVIEAVTGALGVDLASLAGLRPPDRAAQLALLGTLIVADWVASNERYFPGIDRASGVGWAVAQGRAAAGWQALGLRGGWDPAVLPRHHDAVKARFGWPARPSQQAVMTAAEELPVPGLIIVEAPMGEGKTEAALAAAEVLARRFGADGVFVGMPTQATSDPMFSRVRRWAATVDGTVPVALLHGKARFNREWQALRGQVRITGVDEYGCPDEYAPGGSAGSGQAPAEWFLGAKRGLLAPVVVGTVDQLLHAATRTRHVMLRHAGLAGKVVILDEVHAYDVYMSQFLHEALRWLAGMRVPVVVLSATLPPAARSSLVRAYLQGALGARDVTVDAVPASSCYPAVLAVGVDRGGEVYAAGRPSVTWRPAAAVTVQVAAEPAEEDSVGLVTLLADRLTGGGCALVVRNTVGRAQQTFRALQARFGSDVVLLHGRLTVRERAERTERLLALLGPPGDAAARPQRLVVVATQIAEQSFDVDCDLLVSDLAPIDLLLQRIGRLHRHGRPESDRPTRVSRPTVVVTGLRPGPGGVPVFPTGSRAVYGEHLLLRAAALVEETTRGGDGVWTVPTDVPALVARGYADNPGILIPDTWASVAEAAAASWQAEQDRRAARARQFLLAGEDELGRPTLAGLHDRAVADLDDDDRVAAVVRDGDPSVEVVLIRRGPRGYTTLDGYPLGPTGEAISDADVLERVVGDSVRLPPDRWVTADALAKLTPLPAWTGDPWLGRTRALVLDEASTAELGGRRFAYDTELGLTAEPTAGKGR